MIDAMYKGKSEKGLVVESFDCDEESVSSEDEGVTMVKAFIAITEDEPSIRKADARSRQWVEITMKKLQRLLSMTDGDERKHVLNYTHVDFHYVEDQRKILLSKFNSLSQELSLYNKVTLDQLLTEQGPGNIANESPTETALEITSDSESECDIQESLPPLPKLIGIEPTAIKAPKKRTQTVSNPNLEKKADPSTKQLLLTLMKEVKGLKEKIKIPSDTSLFLSQSGILKEICDTEGYGLVNYNGITFTRVAYVNGLKHNLISISQLCDANFKLVFHLSLSQKIKLVQPVRKGSTTEHHSKPRDLFPLASAYLLHMDLLGRKKSDAADCIMSFIRKMENLNEVRVIELRNDNGTEPLGKFDAKADDGFFLGYSLVAKAFRIFNIRRQEMEEIFHVTFSEDDEAISKSITEDDEINFNENKFFPDVLIPRNTMSQCLENDVDFPYDLNSPDEQPKFTIASDHPVLNEHNDSKSVEDLGIAKDQVFTIIEPVSNVEASPTIISPSAKVFINQYVPQDRWSREKQIELNKARLVAQGYNQHKGINYDETFAPVAKFKAIRIFLAYAAYVGFVVFQVDVKSVFLNRKISEEVYVKQPCGFESSEFPNHVCKLDKALYGLKQAPRAWYQTNLKESYLVDVKRIFKYLKGTPNLCLWYPKGSGFDLKAYSDSDYIGCNLDRKSTSGGFQLLGGKLVCWGAKKQSSMAMLSGEAEYVAAAGCCAQVLWIKSQLADYNVLYDKVPIFYDNTSAIAISNNPVLHSKTKYIDIRYHFIRDIELNFVPTELQLADIFIKPLAKPSFTRLVDELGMLNIQKEVPDKKKDSSDTLT
ncbi:retrovirus-related pol polyprotein from transposon TNT 1-94 [Tanacetum coccineum]|uniref:Retrovirus-related pol polyprotein from transposon TNT 1-94 n=1 Tax=Tanacetum coccineum TaxID=301880 RepID=A0ABQ4ZSV9_9ASTR